MEMFTALKASMGSWQYYIIKMSLSAIKKNVEFAADVYDDHTLSEAIQRQLHAGHRNGICDYLVNSEDRFFNSIVIAAFDGDPKWYPVTMEDQPQFQMLAEDEDMQNTFGIIQFNGKQKYYALDGQHRLSAIKAVLDSTGEYDPPKNLGDETLSVIMVVPDGAETNEEFMIRYRRLFGHLNRYAKPTSHFDNIVMDEDDAIAITTRRLITENDFFKWSGKEMDSARVHMFKGKNVSASQGFFCTLENLYKYNQLLLTTPLRVNDGWGENGATLENYIKIRPSSEELDALSEELNTYWNSLVKTLPDLNNPAQDMRNHSADPDDEEDPTTDSALFWPICQEVMIDVARHLINSSLDEKELKKPTANKVSSALVPLSELCWDLHLPPWRHMALKNDPQDLNKWSMRSEERKPVMNLIRDILLWQLGLNPKNKDQVQECRENWESYLVVRPNDEEVEKMWKRILSGQVRSGSK